MKQLFLLLAVALLLLAAGCRQSPAAANATVPPPSAPAGAPAATNTAIAVGTEVAAPMVVPAATLKADEEENASDGQETPMEAPAGRIVQESFPSAAMGEEINYNIYLPAGYDEGSEAYPVLYLLHGRGDSLGAWTIVREALDELIGTGAIPPLLAVIPDAPWSERGNYYVDSAYTGQRYPGRPVETAFVRDLVAHVDDIYRTLAHRGARAVGGYSMGGYGALRYALAYPDVYMGAIVLSPAVYFPLPPEDSSTREFGAFGRDEVRFDPGVYQALNYPALLEAYPESGERGHLFIAVGDDEWKSENPEDYLHDLDFEAHLLFNKAVRVSNLAAELRVLDGGHDWDVWLPAFREGAVYLLNRMEMEPPADEEAGGTMTFGTSGVDYAGGLAADGEGNLFVAAAVSGALDEGDYSGALDTVVVKFGPGGERLWTRQLGTGATERPYGAALDGAGGVYVAGYTTGNLDGEHGDGGDDAFVARLDPDGTLLWIRQFGLVGVADRAYALASGDDGSVYVSGYSKGALGGENHGDKDVFLAKYDRDGNRLWLKQFGTLGEDKGFGIAVDDSQGRIYLTGVAGGALASFHGDLDAFLIAFDLDGNRLWVQQFGTRGWDQGDGVAVGPQGDIYVTGFTAGDFGAQLVGDKDLFVARFSGEGEQLAADQVGSEFNDKGAGLAFAADGNLFVAGFSNGDLAGQQGKFDVLLLQYGAGLQRLGLSQYGSTADDAADEWAERNLFVTVGGGDVILSGLTMGRISEQPQRGAGDVFLMRMQGDR